MNLQDIELFHGLSAVEQSRLLGSMERLELEDKTCLFRQGDTGDCMYVVVSGAIQLYTLDENGREHPLVRLGDGETCGEMALLTGQPRTASAETSGATVLYKMDTKVFERQLAEKSEISAYLTGLLSKRLANTNERLRESESRENEVVRRHFAVLSSNVRRLVLLVCSFPAGVPVPKDIVLAAAGVTELDDAAKWYVSERGVNSCAVLTMEPEVHGALKAFAEKEISREDADRLLCSAADKYIEENHPEQAVQLYTQANRWNELAELTQSLLCKNPGDKKVLDAAFAYLERCPEEILAYHKPLLSELLQSWLENAADVGLSKTRLLLQNPEAFDSGELARLYWMAAEYCKKLGEKQKALAYMKLASSTAGSAGAAEPGASDTDGEHEYGLAEQSYKSQLGIRMADQVRGHLFHKKGLAVIIASLLSILLMLFFSKATPVLGISHQGMMFIGITLSAIVFWIVDVLPPFIVALLMVLAWVVSGSVKPEMALSGFSMQTWLYTLCIFAFGTAIAQSGLLYRLSLHTLHIFPKTYVGQLSGLALSGILFSPLLPSSSAKVSLSSSIAQGISEAMGFEDQSSGSAGLCLAAMIFYGYTSPFFLTGSYINLIAWSLVPGAGRISWIQWLIYSLAPLVVFSVGMFIVLLVLFRPSGKAKKISDDVLHEQMNILGKMGGKERTTAVVAIMVILLLITQSLHGIDSTWIMLGGVAVLFFTGVMDEQTLKNGINWPAMIFMGVSLSFEEVLPQTGVVNAVSKLLDTHLQFLLNMPYLFITVLALLGFIVTLFIWDETAVVLLVVSLAPLMQSAGISPWILVLIVIMTTDPFFFPYQSSTYLSAYYSTQQRAFSHSQGQKLARWFAVVTIISITASIFYWKLIGLIK